MAQILDIGVPGIFRGKGLGKQLLMFAEEVARKHKVYCVYLSTYAKAAEPIHFYIRNSYVPVATLPNINGPKKDGNVFLRKILT